MDHRHRSNRSHDIFHMFSARFSQVQGISVTLPDGTSVSATHCAQAKTNYGISLRNVLVVPSFTYNLVSVSKLLKDSDLKVIFKDGRCDIMNLETNEVVGCALE